MSSPVPDGRLSCCQGGSSEPSSTNPTHLRTPHFTFPPVDVSAG
jgi:hypothetical protein